MHGHLVECINEYGPLSSFWLFPFERYNGILEGTPTNNRSIEVQIMRKFLVDIQNLSLLQLEKANSILADAVLSQAATFQSTTAYKGKRTSSNQLPLVTYKGFHITPAPKHTLNVLSQRELRTLREMYSKFYPEFSEELKSGAIELPASYQKIGFIKLEGRILDSNAYYMAENILPFGTSGSAEELATGVTDLHLKNSRPVKVLYYAVHRFFASESSIPVSSVLARVWWPQLHPNKHFVGKPIEIWCPDLYEAYDGNDFVPVENMKCPLLTSETYVNHERVLVTIPVL